MSSIAILTITTSSTIDHLRPRNFIQLPIRIMEVSIGIVEAHMRVRRPSPNELFAVYTLGVFG